MKTKLITLTWRGCASVDPRFSSSMLSWSIADIRTREYSTRLSVGIENGLLESFNADFELQFAHHLKYIVGMCKVTRKPESRNKYQEFGVPRYSKTDNSFMEICGPEYGIVYLLKNPRDPLLHIHLYESDCVDEMTELMHQMRDPVHQHGGSVGSIPQSIVSKSNDLILQKNLKGQSIQSTPASNLKLSEAVRNAHHDGSPTVSTIKMSQSKSYTSGINNSAGTVNIPTTSNSSSNVAGSLALLDDISANHSQFFEVLYVGKIKVSHKRVPFSFIDDALPKFKAYDAQRLKLQTEAARRNSSDSNSSTDTLSLSQRSFEVDDVKEVDQRTKSPNELKIVEDADSSKTDETEFKDKILNTKLSEENKENNSPQKKDKILMRGQSQMAIPAKKEVPKQRDRSASIGSIPPFEQNRTMVFLVGRSDLRLISPDRKQVLLYKQLSTIASCAQGNKNADHFGIICREAQNDGYIGYVFKCQSEQVADDIVASISQAFVTCSETRNKEKTQIFSCEHCPMLWYSKLCSEVDGLSDKKTQSTIFKRIDTLIEEEQDMVMAKYYGAEEMAGHSLAEQNQFLMMLLRAHCESRQQRHVHDTAENRSEFLNQYLGGSTIFMKAKRSLTSSFDHLLKRKGSKDDFLPPPLVKEIQSHSTSHDHPPDHMRPRAVSIGSHPGFNKPYAEIVSPPQIKSPMMDIFLKVGNSPKESSSHTGSWRQEILHRVVTPSKNSSAAALMSPLRSARKKRGKRTKDELRELWKTAIRQTILLARMEKENATLQARQNEHEMKRIKLEYDEISPCDKQAADMWDLFMGKEDINLRKRDPKLLLQAIKNGVPRSKRGEIWLFLAEQKCVNTAPVDTRNFPNFNTPYNVLLKSLTEHQHAIFIDLGRTFPNHKYYKQSLGVGQLSLFNLLKAYSILDPELGYCQGLGFICGILLLHLDEADAFHLLKHLMFKRQMRTKYLPDMKQFQLQLYQLSRLLRDYLPDLYDWLDLHEVSPTLYAAPWILTVFSSQFPLGFVTRVFDMLFLASSEIIFRVAIALLEIHKDELMKRDNFEDIMNYLKNIVPNIDSLTMDKVLKQVFTIDIHRQLAEYQVEYNVLQEEITTQNHHLDTLNRAKEENHNLETQLQIAETSIGQLEKTRLSQQNQVHSLQSQVQSLEVTVETLGQFLSNLIDNRHDIELPGEIRRIVQQINNVEQRKKQPLLSDKKMGKSLSVNSHLGLRVLEELNESLESPSKKKSQFFGNTYEQIRQQKAGMKLNKLEIDVKRDEMKLPDFVEKAISNMTSPIEVDSGVCTPLSPTQSIIITNPSTSPATEKLVENVTVIEEMHPFSGCGDVNFKFNGTTQLKSIRPVHNRAVVTPRTLSHTEVDKNGRS